MEEKREFGLGGKKGEEKGREEARQGRVWVRKTLAHSESPVMTDKLALHTTGERQNREESSLMVDRQLTKL